ncbi:SAM-dependent methyltransferase [Glycomyces sp. NPDC047010]|uniref:SAM-dependent methyltransferase n=1 Tax=Glycomyces sp. NPDC047010 TaxID=3155023 RepID=UPI003401ED27
MAADSIGNAKEEIFRSVDDVVEMRRIGAECAIVETRYSTAEDLSDIVNRVPLVFPRHVTNVVAEFDPSDSGLADVADAVDSAIREQHRSPEVSLQVWQSGKTVYGFNRREAWDAAAQVLADRGFTVSRTGAEYAVSVCYTPKTAVVGFNRVADSLSSWPGGEVRLSRPPEQVSRAEFKLEELFKEYDLPFADGGTALDYGAAPGGWTRILAERGFRTTAVDPGDLDPTVLKRPDVVHERTTAGNYLRNSDRRFDLIVNDMKMSPDRSSQLMIDSLPLLKRHGMGILTLKTGVHHALAQLDASFAILRRGFTIEFARQLRHNRNEVTAVLRSLD